MLTMPKSAPWHIERWDTGDSRRTLIMGKDGIVADVDWSATKHNEQHAALMIAAPKMLAAIKRLLSATTSDEHHHAMVALEESVSDVPAIDRTAVTR